MSRSLIISLYESNYPVVVREEPKWEELPNGFFVFQSHQLNQMLKNDKETAILFGNYYHSDHAKPRIGEHHLATFSFKRTRYLYFSTISFSAEAELNWRKWTWWSRLALSRLQRKW